MSENFRSDFLEMRDLYEETMEEIEDELSGTADYPEAECDDCDAPEYVEASVAENHWKIIMSVVGKAMDIVGKSIYSAVDEEYSVNTDDYKRGDCLHFGSGIKSCYALYIGFGKIIFYSKGYDIFPEVKISALGSVVKSNNNIIVLENYHAVYSPELNNLKIEKFSSSDFADIKQLADTSASLKKGAVAGGAAGAAIALGAGTVAIDTLLGAGTIGWAASSLGIGAAADLALVGIGGLVPGLAIVAGPALLIGGFASYMKADENLEKAKTALAQSEEAAEKMETAEYLCRQIERRSDMFIDLLSNLKPLLKRSVDELNRISGVTCTITITKKPPSLFQFIAGLFNIQLKDRTVTKKAKKNDYNNLNNEEKAFLAMSGAIAKAVKSVLDTPILDSDGDVTYESENLYDELDEKVPVYEKQQQMLLAKIR